MAISRAQLLKELLPGLNALFGLEYEKYEGEHAEIYETENYRCSKWHEALCAYCYADIHGRRLRYR